MFSISQCTTETERVRLDRSVSGCVYIEHSTERIGSDGERAGQGKGRAGLSNDMALGVLVSRGRTST